MRVPKIFGQRTVSRKEEKPKFILIFEGEKTEPIYFNGVSQYSEDIGISSLISIFPLLRSYSEISCSNPQSIINNLVRSLEENTTSGLSMSSIVRRVMDYLIEQRILIQDKCNCNMISNLLLNFTLEKFGYTSDEIVTDIREVLKGICSFINSGFDTCLAIENVLEYIKDQDITYDKSIDKICIIIDRDRKSFKDDQYDYVMKTCADNGFQLFVSNPCFEFWLLLHFDDIDVINPIDILDNKRPTPKSKRKFTEIELRKRLPGYNKANFNFIFFKNRIQSAIIHEKNYCENITNLKNELGSNIGVLIEEMRNLH